MRIKLIFNPTANQGHAASLLPEILSVVEKLPEVEMNVTLAHGHAIELASKAAEEGFERVIAMGGDGTTHEIVNGLMSIAESSRPELGIVPMGSGNDFSFAGGLQGSRKDLVDLAIRGKSESVDIGVLHDNLGRCEYWVNSLGIGFDALINIYSRKIRGVSGFWIYLLAALRTIAFNYTSFHFDARLDDHAWSETLLMLIIANGKREGGAFMIAPGGRLDDHKVDYSAVRLISRLQMLKTLIAYMKGTQNSLPFVKAGSFGTLDLNSDSPLIIHTDGEIFAGLDSQTTHVQIESVPAAIRLVNHI